MLEINEQLAAMIITATNLYSQVKEHIKAKGYKDDEFPGNVLEDMSDKVCKMITDLGDVVGRDIINQALDEEEKRSNSPYPKGYVSEDASKCL